MYTWYKSSLDEFTLCIFLLLHKSFDPNFDNRYHSINVLHHSDGHNFLIIVKMKILSTSHINRAHYWYKRKKGNPNKNLNQLSLATTNFGRALNQRTRHKISLISYTCFYEFYYWLGQHISITKTSSSLLAQACMCMFNWYT